MPWYCRFYHTVYYCFGFVIVGSEPLGCLIKGLPRRQNIVVKRRFTGADHSGGETPPALVSSSRDGCKVYFGLFV